MRKRNVPCRSYWPKAFMTEWLDLYKQLECLWKPQSADYTTREKRDEAYDVLLAKTREMEPQADRVYLLTKINSIRTAYRKEVRKVLASQACARSPEEIYRPRLWYFDSLSFLRNSSKDTRLHFIPEDTSQDSVIDSNSWTMEDCSNPEEQDIEPMERKPVIVDVFPEQDEHQVPRASDKYPQPDGEEDDAPDQRAVHHSADPSGYLTSGPPPCKQARLSDGQDDPLARNALLTAFKLKDEHDQFGEYVALELRSLKTELSRRRLKSEIRKAIVRIADEEDLQLLNRTEASTSTEQT